MSTWDILDDHEKYGYRYHFYTNSYEHRKNLVRGMYRWLEDQQALVSFDTFRDREVISLPTREQMLLFQLTWL
jgi:hypothetical protein